MILFISVLVIPFLAGVFLTFFHSDPLLEFTENIHGRLIRKRRLILYRRTRFSSALRFILEPVLSLLIAINEWTRDIENTGLKSGLRIAGYLYLMGLFLFGIITIAYFPVILIFIALGVIAAISIEKLISEKAAEKKVKKRKSPVEDMQTFLETFWPLFKYRPTKENVERLFRLRSIDVDIKGNIFSIDRRKFSEKTKVGLVDIKGGIYDIRDSFPKKIGRVDNLGNVYEEHPPHQEFL